jgi:hypothetical protein
LEGDEVSDEEYQADLDAAYACDDEQQKEIDKLNADPWEPVADSKGFKPVDLTDEDASKGTELWNEGYRNRHTQEEIVEILDTGLRPLTDRDNKELVIGQIAFISMQCKRGPNENKRIDQSWWLRDGEKDAVRDMNKDLQKIFGRFDIEPKLVDLGDGRKAPSYTGTLSTLEGRTVKMVLQQKWDYPYQKMTDGSWEALTDEPKKFKKRILDLKPV